MYAHTYTYRYIYKSRILNFFINFFICLLNYLERDKDMMCKPFINFFIIIFLFSFSHLTGIFSKFSCAYNAIINDWILHSLNSAVISFAFFLRTYNNFCLQKYTALLSLWKTNTVGANFSIFRIKRLLYFYYQIIIRQESIHSTND